LRSAIRPPVNRDDHAILVLLHPAQCRAEFWTSAQVSGDPGRQRIVASGEAHHATATGRITLGEEIHERKERQLLRVGEKEPAQGTHSLDEPGIRIEARQPVGRERRARRRDCAIPSPLSSV
jgi:hypothetical protein